MWARRARRDSPKIEYRTALSGFAFLLPHVITVIFIPFVIYFGFELFQEEKEYSRFYPGTNTA